MIPQLPPLQLDWLKIGGAPLIHTPGKVALSICPGRPDCQVKLDEDLGVLEGARISAVLSLVDDEEMAEYGVSTLPAGLARRGLRHLRYPMIDGCPPSDMEATRALCLQLLALLGEGENLLIHCIGGWGRSGTIAACLLSHEGLSGQRAIEMVRRARSPHCIETVAQEVFVHRYARRQGEFRRLYHFLRTADARRQLQGPPGARRLDLDPGSALRADVTVDLLPRALVQVHHQAPGEDVIVLSGEVPAAGPPPPGPRPVDRAHRVENHGLLPLSLATFMGASGAS